jgi:hypothetical protein
MRRQLSSIGFPPVAAASCDIKCTQHSSHEVSKHNTGRSFKIMTRGIIRVTIRKRQSQLSLQPQAQSGSTRIFLMLSDTPLSSPPGNGLVFRKELPKSSCLLLYRLVNRVALCTQTSAQCLLLLSQRNKPRSLMQPITPGRCAHRWRHPCSQIRFTFNSQQRSPPPPRKITIRKAAPNPNPQGTIRSSSTSTSNSIPTTPPAASAQTASASSPPQQQQQSWYTPIPVPQPNQP